MPTNDLETLGYPEAVEWEAWLADHHDRVTGVWLKIAKKGSGRTSITTAEALDVALCYGWIDSHRRSFDEQCFLQKYSPRRPRSSWSQVNVDKVGALIAAGRMQAAGLEQVRAARADGRWDRAYESQRTASVPPDLAAALDGSGPAKRRFESLGKTDRYAVILRLLKASGPADRAARLRKVIDALTSHGER